MRILELSRDPLFAKVYPEHANWVPTGRPLEPYGRLTGHSSTPRTSWFNALAGLAGNRYDLAVLPAIRLSVPGDRKNRSKARLRRSLIRLSASGLVSNAVRVAMRLESTPHVIRDVGDFPQIEEISTKLFRDASLYLKREVFRDDLGTIVGNRAIVTYTPMPFDLEPYAIDRECKTVDVFYSAKDNSPHRHQARRVLAELATSGIVVDMPHDRLPFEEFLARMARARLVVSPRGQGEHCYRHYEALLVGTCPVINRPETPVYYELIDREHALFYDATDEGLRNAILSGLANPADLAYMVATGATLVRKRHDKATICHAILESLGLPDPESS